MTRIRVTASIVGGGPAGLRLGLLLARRGADVQAAAAAAPFTADAAAAAPHLRRAAAPLDPAFTFQRNHVTQKNEVLV
jgi:2-polyprenyl-6-methoxyphenol hydroxylase-like FAD-dependent oxidoreductase